MKALVKKHAEEGLWLEDVPIPIIGGLFNPAVMSIVYVFVAVKLFLGFDKTNYSADKKVVMTALWPLLAATNPSFRENLKRATMG